MNAERYTAVAIVLHWAIAAAILFNLPLGFWMHEQAEDGATPAVFAAFQLHKSIGLTVLALSLLRLGWRLANPPPPFPPHMPEWERIAARAVHWGFYVLTIALPLSGWVFVSAGWSLHEDRSLATPTRWFGLIEVAPLFGLPQASEGVREAIAEAAFEAHELFAWAAIGLAVVHVAAALKHHFFDRDAVLAQMLPGLRAPFESAPPPRNPGRLAALGVGLALVAVALTAAGFAVADILNRARIERHSSIEIAAPPPSPAPAAQAAPAAPEAPAAATPQAAPARWAVEPSASSIGFSYLYSDEAGETRFEGRFTRWRADIRFDPANLAASHADVTIETASASTGVAAHDASLPTPEWFDSAAHPTARFRTEAIRRRGGGYEAVGELTIRGRSREVAFPFDLDIEGDRATMSGSLVIDRRDFDVGEDAEGDELVSREVRIDIRVGAVRAP